MTTQEFVKKKTEEYHSLHGNGGHFKPGLTKGLEIAKEFAEWIRERAETGFDGTWHLYSNDRIYKSVTTSELLTIFLTEKYGNNG